MAYVSRTCSQVFDATVQENRPKLIRKYEKLLRNETPSGKQNSLAGQRVNNLSSLPLGEQGIDLLSRGPNFAITQNISSQIVLEAMKGVERFAYAKRWKDALRRTKQTKSDSMPTDHQITTTIATTNETTSSYLHPADGVIRAAADRGASEGASTAGPPRNLSGATSGSPATNNPAVLSSSSAPAVAPCKGGFGWPLWSGGGGLCNWGHSRPLWSGGGGLCNWGYSRPPGSDNGDLWR